MALARNDDISIGILLQIAGRMMTEHLETAGSDVGLSGPQLSFLGMVARFPGNAQMTYGQILSINKMSAGRYAAQLEELGLIERQRGTQDAREIRLQPTPEGLALFGKLRQRLSEMTVSMTARAGTPGYGELEAHLRRFLANEGWSLPQNPS